MNPARIWLQFLGFIATFLLCCSSAVSFTPGIVELELVHAWFTQPIELSGLSLQNDKLLIVSDQENQRQIYSLTLSSNQTTYELTPYLDFTKLTGYSILERHLTQLDRLLPKGRLFDLEGISQCGSDIYVVNERVREVYKITPTTISSVQLAWRDRYEELEKGGANAGFEGIDFDCANGHLYLAKEREPRMIYKWDMTSGQLIGAFDFSAPPNPLRNGLNYQSGASLYSVAADVAEIHFNNGFLYAIERWQQQIVKIDPKNGAVLSSVSYSSTENGLYDRNQAYGQAEGLAMDANYIYIAIDNGRDQLTKQAAQYFGVNPNKGFIGKFKRPKDF